MPPFVTAQISADPQQILDASIDQINQTLAANGYPGWSANDGALAVIILSTVAQIAADVAQVAATVVPAIFRAFGTLLLGIPYQQGEYANIVTVWNFTTPAPSGGYLIPAGIPVVVSGSAFYTTADFTTATGATSATLTLQAASTGTAYNDLGGVNQPAQLVSGIDWVSNVLTSGLSSGGQDQESDADYQDRLATVLTLQAPRPITAADFATIVQTDLADTAIGVIAGRATSIDGYYPDGRPLSTGGSNQPTVLACSTTSTSPTVNVTGASGTQVPAIGATVSGLTAPVLSTPTAHTTGGSFSAGTYYWVLTALNGIGETTGSNEVSVAVAASGTATLTWTQVTGATGYKLYRASTTGGESTSPALVTSIGSGSTTTYTDTGTATTSGAVPASNSTLPFSSGTTVAGIPTESSFTASQNATATATGNLIVNAMSGYGPQHLTCQATLTSTSPTVSLLSNPYPFAIPDVGARVTGTGIPAGATVLASPPPSATGFALSANATITGPETLTISSWTQVERTVTTFVTDTAGNPLTAAAMDALVNWLSPNYREANTNTFITTPSYSTIYVTSTIHVLPGFSGTAVASQAQTAVINYLNPATWGQIANQSAWLNSGSGFNLIRLNKLIGVIENVPGVDYIPDNGITLGFTASPSGTADLTMPGPAPLPTSSSGTILITAV